MLRLLILAGATALATASHGQTVVPGTMQPGATGAVSSLPDLSDATAFSRTARSMFSRWDTNRDNRLEGDEFIEGLRTAWSDGEPLEQNGFERGWSDWFPETERPGFETLDENGDGTLSAEELRAGINDADLAAGWQGAEDGYLTPEEFEAGLRHAAERG